MRGVKAWSAPLGILLLLVAGAWWVFLPWNVRFQAALAIAGGALVVLALALNLREVGGLLGRRTARYGAATAVMVLLALGIVVFANALSLRHSARWDLTENKRHSLSPQTIKVLQTLRAPVEAIAFFRADTPGKRTAEDTLKQYASYSGGRFTWRMEDPDRAPGLARRYGVESYGTVVLERGGKGEAKSEKILDAEEEKLTNALVKVTREGKRTIYAVKGHGEHDIASAERAGFSQAREQIEKANYGVKELTLAREAKVPEDAAIVIVAGPRVDLLAPELDALDAYIARGGKVLFMVDPFVTDGLARYLARYGFQLAADVVIELNPIGQIFGVGPQVPVITQYESHPITRDMGGLMTLFPLTRSVEPVKAPPKGVSAQALARTSPQSWGETDRTVFQKGTASPDANEKKGPLSVAAVATVEGAAGDKPDAGADKKPTRARLVVLGTSGLASNQFIGAQGNRDFFLNAVSWLAEEEDLISIRAKDTRQSPVFLTAAQERMVTWLPLFVLPGAVMGCGIAVVVRRRRSR